MGQTTFAERLRYLMENKLVKGKKVTSTRIGKETPIKRQSIDLYVKGEQEPSIDKAIIIAQYFGVTLGWLLTGEGPETEFTKSYEYINFLKEQIQALMQKNEALIEEKGRLKQQIEQLQQEDYTLQAAEDYMPYNTSKK